MSAVCRVTSFSSSSSSCTGVSLGCLPAFNAIFGMPKSVKKCCEEPTNDCFESAGIKNEAGPDLDLRDKAPNSGLLLLIIGFTNAFLGSERRAGAFPNKAWGWNAPEHKHAVKMDASRSWAPMALSDFPCIFEFASHAAVTRHPGILALLSNLSATSSTGSATASRSGQSWRKRPDVPTMLRWWVR
jgi:hypothetical protein